MRRIARTVLTVSDRSRSGSGGGPSRHPGCRPRAALWLSSGRASCAPTRLGERVSSLRPAEQALCELAALDNEVVQRLVELLVTNHELVALVGREERCLAQQLANERTSCPLRPLDESVEVGIDRQPAGVEIEQAAPAGCVGERDLDRLVDAAGPGRQ